jgi:bacillopeptidase F (M6 metalloprotease family)
MVTHKSVGAEATGGAAKRDRTLQTTATHARNARRSTVLGARRCTPMTVIAAAFR